MPVTGFASKPDDIPDLIAMVGGAPLVIKLLEGTQGIGVVLAETKKAAESVIEAFLGLKANILVQEYIKEANGSDIRCFVVGDKVVAAMKRQGRRGIFDPICIWAAAPRKSRLPLRSERQPLMRSRRWGWLLPGWIFFAPSVAPWCLKSIQLRVLKV